MAHNLNVDQARNGEEDTATPGVPSSCAPGKSAALDNLKPVASVASSGSNNESEPVTPGHSRQATTTQSLESNGCNTPSLRCGEKRERGSDNPSEVPVKRRLRLSKDNGRECSPDYDERCAELWIDGEVAACEAYELSKSSSNTQEVVRQPDNNSSFSQPLTPRDFQRVVRAEVAGCFEPITDLISTSMEWSRTDFNQVINRLRTLQRDTTILTHEIRNMRVNQRLTLDAIPLMNERMSVIQKCVLETHKMLTATRK
ncbi:uncharacterized protein LOC113052674 [Carassius auratus]|uniref:Uncharacterized protein LOC113052674 n=1 Tax=Carassius auratus TaxID=7957 RepID=A0A6P6KMZ3_CARAU|nr:uncharacterized protein LOC113052674 [Carassius auratus]